MERQDVELATNVLSVGLILVCKKGFFGGLKPSNQQVGFCFGFCDAITQNRGYDQNRALAFITMVFESIFGRKGASYIGGVIKNQSAFATSMQEGGDAFFEWSKSGKPPIPPAV
jgi:hypothetical protein